MEEKRELSVFILSLMALLSEQLTPVENERLKNLIKKCIHKYG